MPTRDNVAQLEALLDATTHLIEAKRQVDKVDYDIQVLKNRLGLREQSQSGEGREGDAMDLDDVQTIGDGEEPEGEDGREQSVMSARSGRSRKQVSSAFIVLRKELLTPPPRRGDAQRRFHLSIPCQLELLSSDKGVVELDRVAVFCTNRTCRLYPILIHIRCISRKWFIKSSRSKVPAAKCLNPT